MGLSDENNDAALASGDKGTTMGIDKRVWAQRMGASIGQAECGLDAG
jgi:hypothetical protein